MTLWMNDWVSRRAAAWRSGVGNRVGVTRVRRTGDPSDTESDIASDFEDFECFTLCGNCGYLADKAEGTCPGCGATQWVDLQNKASAEMVRLTERQARHEIPSSFRSTGLVGGLALGAVAGGLGFWLGGGSAIIGGGGSLINAVAFGVVAALSIGTAAYFLVIHVFSALAFRRRPLRPIRWRLPQPTPEPAGKTETLTRGPLVVSGELLTAPVSGRSCAGYEVSVLFDAPDDKRPPMWVLEEERTVACAVGGHELPADGATLWLEAEPVSFDGGRSDGTGTSSEAQISRFLRQRGLFVADGEYAICEAILVPGETYRLVQSAQPAGARPAIARATSDAAKGDGQRVTLQSRDEVAVAFRQSRRLEQLLIIGAVGVAFVAAYILLFY